MSGTVRQIVVTTDPGTPYFLQVNWAVDLGAGFTLALTDGNSDWIGEVSEDEVTKEASELGVTRETYVEDLLQALTGTGVRQEGNSEAYAFHLTADHHHLSCHKIFDGISVQLVSVGMQPAPDPLELKRGMIIQSLKFSTDLELKNGQLLEENRRHKREHQQILRELQQQVQEKETLERELYSHFVMVLNEKKAKIRGLQDAVHHLQQTPDPQRDERLQQSNEDVTQNTTQEQSYHPSQESTVLITGRDLVCHGISLDRTFSHDEDEWPRRKRRLHHSPSPEPPEQE